jgi:hypothetical protein
LKKGFSIKILDSILLMTIFILINLSMGCSIIKSNSGLVPGPESRLENHGQWTIDGNSTGHQIFSYTKAFAIPFGINDSIQLLFSQLSGDYPIAIVQIQNLSEIRLNEPVKCLVIMYFDMVSGDGNLLSNEDAEIVFTKLNAVENGHVSGRIFGSLHGTAGNEGINAEFRNAFFDDILVTTSSADQ